MARGNCHVNIHGLESPCGLRLHAVGAHRDGEAARFLGAAALAATLALAGEGRAQTQLPGGFNLEGTPRPGWGFIDKPPPEQLGKFEEYRDFNNGLFLPDLRLRLFTPDEKYPSFDFAGGSGG
jgi:hypothetical protein